MYGTEQDDVLSGLYGNDVAYGKSGNDSLAGNEDNDGFTAEQAIRLQAEQAMINFTVKRIMMFFLAAMVAVAFMAEQAMTHWTAARAMMCSTVAPMIIGIIPYNGEDTYRFGRGSGRDTIIDRDATPGNLDTILLEPDVAPEDVVLSHRNDDLILTIKDTGDTITVMNWFKNELSEYQVERIAFSDDTVWDVAAIKQILLQNALRQ